MRHVQESTGSVSLHPHIPRLCKASQRPESTGTRDLSLVLFVCREIRYAPHSIALDLDVGRQHLPDERAKATQQDDQDLVFRYRSSAICLAGQKLQRTVYGQVSQSRAGGSLYFDIGALKKEENRLEGVAVDFSDI